MERRGYKPDKIWRDGNYRGKVLGVEENWCDSDIVETWYNKEGFIYSEHDDFYLNECVENLRQKGIEVYEN